MSHELRNKTLSPNSGFTLIELLVVMGIIALLVGIGIANYQNFNRNQILSQAAQNLRSNLRDAQNRALSGEKICGPSACGGTNSTCGDEAGEKPLDGWRVEFTAPRFYRLYGVCGVTTFNQVSFNLPDVLEFSVFPIPNPILFKSLTHGTNINGETSIILRWQSDPSKTQTVKVGGSGEIK